MRTLYSVRLEGLAANPAAPADLLLLILERAEPRMRNALLRRAGVPDEVYEAAARHPDPRTRRLVAASGHAPVAIRARLAGDPDPAVRRAVASAPEHWAPAAPLPRDVVARLASDSDPQVRDALSGHASLPGAVRAALAADPDAKVRMGALLAWPEPPDEVVDAALEDPDPAVRRLAMKLACHRRPEFAAPLLATGQASAVSTVPLDAGQAREVCRDPRPATRAAAAANPHLPPDLVALLAADEDFVVRLLLSEHHPDPPGDLLLAVALESPFLTRLDQVGHPNFPSAGLARLAGSDDPVARILSLRDPALGPGDVDRLSRDADPAVRSAAARDERLPAPRLLELLDDPDAAGSAARNPGLPEASMKRILYDVAII